MINSVELVNQTVLKSGYTIDQIWKGLKSWLGYAIAKNKAESR